MGLEWDCFLVISLFGLWHRLHSSINLRAPLNRIDADAWSDRRGRKKPPPGGYGKRGLSRFRKKKKPPPSPKWRNRGVLRWLAFPGVLGHCDAEKKKRGGKQAKCCPPFATDRKSTRAGGCRRRYRFGIESAIHGERADMSMARRIPPWQLLLFAEERARRTAVPSRSARLGEALPWTDKRASTLGLRLHAWHGGERGGQTSRRYVGASNRAARFSSRTRTRREVGVPAAGQGSRPCGNASQRPPSTRTPDDLNSGRPFFGTSVGEWLYQRAACDGSFLGSALDVTRGARSVGNSGP